MTLSFVLGDEFSATSSQVLAEVAKDGALVPTLWDYEVLNGLRSAERRGRIKEADTSRAIAGLELLPIERFNQVIDSNHIAALSREYTLTVYDAAYMWLAMRVNLPLATLDTPLRSAATSAGIDVLY